MPLAKMYTLGCGFIPPPNHAGGRRYHGMTDYIPADEELARGFSHVRGFKGNIFSPLRG